MSDYHIPEFVTCPANSGQPTRRAKVAGHGTVEKCPHCSRIGPIPFFLIEPGNIWPNIVFECGRNGCGAFWALGGAPPPNAIIYDEQPGHRPPV